MPEKTFSQKFAAKFAPKDVFEGNDLQVVESLAAVVAKSAHMFIEERVQRLQPLIAQQATCTNPVKAKQLAEHINYISERIAKEQAFVTRVESGVKFAQETTKKVLEQVDALAQYKQDFKHVFK